LDKINIKRDLFELKTNETDRVKGPEHLPNEKIKVMEYGQVYIFKENSQR